MERRTPPRLWTLARLAADAGWDVRVRPYGSTVTLFANRYRDRVEISATWRRRDLERQGDADGGWRLDERASVSRSGRVEWVSLADLPRLIRQEA